jgi:lipopolysaccharide assembly outer membrane protein LptD (OstA)
MRLIAIILSLTVFCQLALAAGNDNLIRITSDTATTDLVNHIATATDNVRFYYGSAQGKCDKLIYNQTTQILELSGHIEIKRGKDILTADKAILDMNAHKITITDKAQILFEIKGN